MVVMVTQQCEMYLVPLKVVKMVNFMLRILHHNLKKKETGKKYTQLNRITI